MRYQFLNKLGLCPNCLASKILEKFDTNSADDSENSDDSIDEKINNAQQAGEFADVLADETKEKLENAKTDKDKTKILSDALMQLFENQYVKKCEEVEDEIMYRRFYFKGTDTYKDIKDSDNDKDKYNIIMYDYRKLPKFQSVCEQERLWENFVVWYNGEYEAHNFKTATAIISNLYYNSENGLYGKEDIIISPGSSYDIKYCVAVIYGLMFANKWDSYCLNNSSTLEKMNITDNKEFTSFFNIKFKEYIRNCDDELKGLLFNSKGVFDYWVADDERKELWFVDKRLIDEYDKAHAQYEQAVMKMLNLFSAVPSLSICLNNVSGTMVNAQIVQQCSIDVSTETGGDSGGIPDIPSFDDDTDNGNKVNTKIIILVIVICFLIACLLGGAVVYAMFKPNNEDVDDELLSLE